MTKIGYVADWKARLLSRFYAQFQGKANLEALARDVVGPQAQDLEDAFQSLLIFLDIDNAEGAQLDMIGDIVEQPRSGVDDPIYRLYLRAKIRANKSSGTPEDLYAVFGAMFGSKAAGLFVYTQGATAVQGKQFQFRIVSPITAAQEAIALAFLAIAKEAAARAVLEWQETPDASTLTTAIGTTVAIATTPADLFIDVPVGTFDGFPTTGGSLILDRGLGNEETVIYTKISGTFILQAPGIVNVHGVGASVELVGEPGLGFPLGSGLSAPAAINDPTLTLASTSGFPSSGTVVVDEGLPTEETIAYTSITAPFTLNLATLVTANHSIGAAVQIAGDGGALAGAADAAEAA